MDYKSSGVDINKGDEFVRWIQSSEPQNMPFKNRLLGGLGGFAGLFELKDEGMKEPCLVAATDGIGTKILLGEKFQQYEGLGQDLVAMCVNDLICVGAQPLFFLDYLACGELDFKRAQPFVEGVRKACIHAGCLLLGGETAEMPGLYEKKQFDSAGFAVGLVDKPHIWGPHRVKPGDALIGVASSGFHSNGYSLLRRVFEPDLESWSEYLLRPTLLYSKLTQHLKSQSLDVHACAHITGGGLSNICRSINKDLKVKLHPWPWPEAFKEVQRRAKMSERHFCNTLNCGLGFVVMTSPENQDLFINEINALGYQSWSLGYVEVKKSSQDLNWDWE